MPKLKKTPEEVIKNIIRARLRYFQAVLGLSVDDMARAAHVSKRTMYNRINDPGTFTLDELLRLAARAKRPVSVFLEEIV